MQSLFPTAPGGSAHAASNIFQFRAGKCHLTPLSNGKFQVIADTRRGQLSLSRENDGLVHFKWANFTTGVVEEDRIVMPGEAVFKKVKTGRDATTDRVFMLKFPSGNQRLMYWMQNKDASKDDDTVKKVNDFLNSNSAAGLNPSINARPNVGATAGLSGLDLSSLLAQFGQPNSSSAPASQINATPAPVTRPPAATPSTSSGITIDDLRRAMLGQSTTTPIQTPGIQDILIADEIMQSGLLEDSEGMFVNILFDLEILIISLFTFLFLSSSK
jgi:hypothetical protein